MKKSILYGLMTSLAVFSVGAYATTVEDDNTTALTTKGYVDAGLKYVYDVASDAQADVDDLADVLNGHAADPSNNIAASNGLINDVADLQTDVSNLQTTVGATGTGLVGDVEALQGVLDDGNDGLINVSNLKADVDNVKGALSDGNGGYIDVGELKTTVDTLDSLSTDGLGNNKTYVLQTNGSGEGSWSEIEVESTWSANAFENNVLNGGN